MASDFGSYLRSRRESLGLSRQRVADRSGLSYAYIAQLESGVKSRPSPGALEQLAAGLELPVEQLAQVAPIGTSDPSTARRPSGPGLRDSLEWHRNPRAASYSASVPAPVRTDAAGELQAARAEVLPALQRLLATYEPATRLALLHELQAEALRDLGS